MLDVYGRGRAVAAARARLLSRHVRRSDPGGRRRGELVAGAALMQGEAVGREAVPLFAMNNVSKAYKHVQALREVDFSVGRNEVVGLLGDNGAGKSTLVRIMSGVESPDSGNFYRDGHQVRIRSRKDSERLGIETIYQDAALVGSATIMRNFFAGRELTFGFGILNTHAMNAVVMDVLLNRVRIAGIDSPDLLVEALSGGQR